jgi:hypothetical protein
MNSFILLNMNWLLMLDLRRMFSFLDLRVSLLLVMLVLSNN